jgi:hypothetical protein
MGLMGIGVGIEGVGVRHQKGRHIRLEADGDGKDMEWESVDNVPW